MATGHELSSTNGYYKGSEEVFDVTCTPCAHEGTNVEAVNFCVDCAEYFCAVCTKYHQKLRLMSTHTVVTADQADQASIPPAYTHYDQHFGVTSTHGVVNADQSSAMPPAYSEHDQNIGVPSGHGVVNMSFSGTSVALEYGSGNGEYNNSPTTDETLELQNLQNERRKRLVVIYVAILVIVCPAIILIILILGCCVSSTSSSES